MKHTAFFIILVLLSIVNVPYQEKNFSMLINGFEKADIELEKFNISGRISFSNDNNDIDNTANNILKTMKLYIDDSDVVVDKNSSKIVYSGKYKSGFITATVETQEGTGLCNAVVNVEQKKDLSNYTQIKGIIENCLGNFGAKPEINLCISGYKEGKAADRNLVLESIMKTAGASSMERIDTGSLISVTGYSPGIEESILCNGKKININAASRYDSYHNKTIFLVASPLINIEY